MTAQRKLAQSKDWDSFEEDKRFRPNKTGCYCWSLNGPVMVPGTSGAMLIVECAVVMMHRGENGAYAQVEQAERRGDGTHHHYEKLS